MVNVTLGVFVEPSEARIALVNADPPNAVIDQSEIDLGTEPDDTLVTTLLATARALTDSGHRLVGTSLSGSDTERVDALRDALAQAGLSGAEVVAEQDAVTAAVRSLSGDQPVATLVNDGRTVSLSMVAAGGATTPIAVETIDDDPESAYRTLLQRFSAEPGAATGLIVMGSLGDDGLPADAVQAAPVPLRFPDDSEFTLARGAALASLSRDATSANPVLSADDAPPTAATPTDHADTMMGQKLAYSEVPDDNSVDYGLADPVGYDEFDAEQDFEDDEAVEEEVRRRQWLIGSSVGALAAVGFATLAVSVAITVEPTTSEQAVRLQDAPVAGKAFPVAPGQGVAPDGPNWTMIEQLPPPGVPAEARTFQTRALNSTRDVANAAAPAVVNVYRDGTVGVQSAAAPLLPAIDPVLPIVPGAVPELGPMMFPDLPDYVTRLIPDFTKIKPTDLLYFIANLRQLIPLDAAAPAIPGGLGLSDIGLLAAVPRDQGALFSADAATGGPSVIPPALFDTSATATEKAQILPPGTTVVETPATDGTADEPADVLSEVLVDPETVPSAPETQAPDTDVERDVVPEERDSTTESEPETTAPATEPSPSPATSAPATSVPTTATDTPTSPAPTRQAPTAEPATPTPEPTVTAEPEPVTPTPTQAPATQAPATQAPAMQAPVTPEPTTQAPPATQAPATQAPATQAPATQAPATQAPPTQAPATRAPETQAPATRAPVTTLPQLPSGGSFGSGTAGD